MIATPALMLTCYMSLLHVTFLNSCLSCDGIFKMYHNVTSINCLPCHSLHHLIPHCCINVTLLFIMKTNLSKEMCGFESGRCMIVF